MPHPEIQMLLFIEPSVQTDSVQLLNPSWPA